MVYKYRFSILFDKISLLHESFLKLSDLDKFVFQDLESSPVYEVLFSWKIMDFSKPMVLDYSEKDNNGYICKLLIPSIYFSVGFIL